MGVKVLRVLWLSNVLLPDMAKYLHKPIPNCGGWLVGASEELKNQIDMQLAIAFPLTQGDDIISGVADGITYYGFSQRIPNPTKYNKDLEVLFESIIREWNPDVIHIWGTEFPHTLTMVYACKKLGLQEKIIISIQGLCSVIAKHYFSDLPLKIIKRHTFRDLVFQDSIYQQKQKFEKRGKFEREALSQVSHVIGRTTWDRACSMQINSSLKYHHCNETLRNSFYKNYWELVNCEKHSIFISQAYYPIKGAHFMLEALALIIKKYPDAKLYIADDDILRKDTWKARMKKTSYAKYIGEQIEHYKLCDNVFFTGGLDEEQMCQRFLKANVFVCPSSIENSPNSLGEAMLLGVPCVASDVGGISDMLIHQKEGFLYPSDAPYMLAHYVCEIFANEDRALSLSENGKSHALRIYNKEKNVRILMEIYNQIFGEE